MSSLLARISSIALAVLTLIETFAGVAQAASCSYLATGDKGDSYYLWDAKDGWKCQQQFIDYWWSAFDFDKADWDEGFGWEAPCDNARPLARTFNALFALGYASTNAPTCDTSSANKTLWSMCWAAANIDELDGRCGNGTDKGTRATTFNYQTRPLMDCYTELYWPFFYGENVVQRASTLFHEARHSGGSGCVHNGGSSCPRGTSCDLAWNDGCAGRPGMDGANKYQVLYLESLAVFGWRVPSSLRSNAVSTANAILDGGFVVDPCKFVSSSGFVMSGGC